MRRWHFEDTNGDLPRLPRARLMADMGANPTRITGSFSVAELAGDYSGPLYAMPRRLGEAVGLVSGEDWKTIEPVLRRVWSDANELTWDEARPAIFVAWQHTRRAFGPGIGQSR